MAKNFVQPGNVVTLPAPSGGVKSGDAVHVGSLFGVCNFDAAAGADVEVSLTGVWQLPKDGNGVTQGAAVYWNGSAVAQTPVSGYPLIGVATERLWRLPAWLLSGSTAFRSSGKSLAGVDGSRPLYVQST